MIIRPIVKIHGGKFYLKKWIIENFPQNYQDLLYGEFYLGAGSVALNKLPSKVEIVSDINPDIFSIFSNLNDDFISKINEIQYTKSNFSKALSQEFDPPINEYVLRRMSRDGLKEAFSWSERKRGGQPGDVNAWETMKKQLPIIKDRIKNWKIFNKPALEMIEEYDGEDSFFYLDPPYLPETRVTKKAYEYEMTYEQHEDLLKTIVCCKSKVLISGYKSELYQDYLKNWKFTYRDIANHASQTKTKTRKIECLWRNY